MIVGPANVVLRMVMSGRATPATKIGKAHRQNLGVHGKKC